MATTRAFISKPVGDGAANLKQDVRNVQRLLIAAGEDVKGGADGGWGDNSGKALESLQRRFAAQGVKVQRLVNPGDYVLLLAAWAAGILIPMPGKAGMSGVLAMHKWFGDHNIKYNAGAEKGLGNRAVWGVEGDPRYAVQTTAGTFQAGPVEMDCTTYVNLMLSINMNGNAHVSPYDAKCADFGGTGAVHCARDRYGLPLVRRDTSAGGKTTSVNFFQTAEQLATATATDPTGLYAIEVATGGTGAVTHMTLLHGGTVYECTTGQSGSACISRSLADFTKLKKGKIYYLFGPSLTRR